jgi:chloride channel 3/4/5
MAIGASFGRTVGIIVQALQEAHPTSVFFSACAPDVPCITPGTYAFLGAAAALSGIMHITITVVVIMFELTGALTYILPTMIVVGVTKIVGDLFGKQGIADRMISFNGFPFLDAKEEHVYGQPVSKVMTADVVTLPATGATLSDIERLLAQGKFQGFPVVEDRTSKILIGYIGHTELQYAVERIKKQQPELSPNARCYFTSPLDTTSASLHHTTGEGGAASVDFSRFLDLTPVTAHPKLPLETVLDMFRKIGPRVILVEYRGRLVGLVTVKDCLKWQFKMEAGDNRASSNDEALREGQEWLWNFFQKSGRWVSDKVQGVSGGRIRLSGESPRPEAGRGVMLDGTEEVEEGVELDRI